VSLSFSNPINIDLSNDRLRLSCEYVQEAGEPIAMEAERATVLRFTPDKGAMGNTDAASGGLAIAYADHAEYHFEVKSPGRYTAWYRGLYPWAGSWNHSENMDGGESHTITDSRGEVLNQWVWSKGPTYDLSAGKHQWNFTPAGWCGGTQLDKVALIRDVDPSPTGLGPGRSPVVSPRTGEVRTEAVRRKNLIRWGRLSLINASGKGYVSASCSTDYGSTWKSVPVGGDLSFLPPDAVAIFRLTLTADNSGASPFASSAMVSYEVKKVPPLVLENGFIHLRLSGESGALQSLRNKVTQTEYVVAGVESPLFSFMALRGEYGTLREIGFSQAELKHTKRVSPNALLLDYELMGGGLTVALSIKLEGRLVRISPQVTNKTIYNIALAKIPTLRGLRIGADEKDDYLMTPMVTGSIAKYPASLKLPRLVYTDRPLTYPGQGTMCWMDLWDAQGGGLYLACEDKEYRRTELTFSPGDQEATTGQVTSAPLPPTEGRYKPADVPGKYVSLGFNKSILIGRTTGTVRLPDIVLGVHEGDWHWGADQYRTWAQPWMVKTPIPDWFRDAEGWVDVHVIHMGDFVDMVKGWARTGRIVTMKNPPFPLFAVWAQMLSCEAYWSTQPLHRILGNEEEFTGGIQKQHELGNRMIFYLLPPHMNPALVPEGKRFGCVPRQMVPDDEIPPSGLYPIIAQRHYDGSLVSPDGGHSEAHVCMAAPQWQQYLNHILLDKYVRQYGADGMYLDGIGLVTYECANLNHGHAGYGEWSQGLNRWMEHIKTETRKARPGAIFAGEGMNDVDHRYLDVGLWYVDNAPEVYRYTFPDNIGVIHGSPIEHYQEYPTTDALQEFATVFGIKYGGIFASFDVDPNKAQQILSFRRKFSQFQSRARFMDELGLRFSDADVKGKLYTRDESGTKGALVAIFNEKDKPGTNATVDVSRVGALKSAWAFTLQGEAVPLKVQQEKDAYRFTIPASRLSAVLLLEKCEPFVDMERVAPVVPGEEGNARVTVRNLGSAPISGKLGLQLPKGWKGSAVEFTLAKGEGRPRNLSFRVADDAKHAVHDIYAVTTERGRTTKKCVPVGICRPIQAEIIYLSADTVKVEMENSSNKGVSGVVNLMTPSSVGVDRKDVPFDIPAKGKGEVVLKMLNVASIQTREHIKAVIRYGKDESYAYELLQPPVLNGGFEQCVAGDGYPDYWNYRQPQELYLKGVALDTTTSVEGKQSLRVDPYDKQNVNAIQTSFVELVPNTRYRFSCSIRRSANHGGIAAQLYSLYAKGPNVTLGNKVSGPLNQWEIFEAEFTSASINVPYGISLNNGTKGAATVWFDDVRIEEVK